MPEDRTIYELIEKERQERRKDIGEIHNRVDQILDAVNKIGKGESQASWVRQSVGLTIAVVALLGFMVPTMISIVRPLQQQMDYIQVATYKHQELPGHLDAVERLARIRESISMGVKAEDLKIEIVQHRMDDIGKRIAHQDEIIEAKAADRFTGAEGKMMQKQIDRLEERLTFLTKVSMGQP